MRQNVQIIHLDNYTTLLVDGDGRLVGIMSEKDLLSVYDLLKRIRESICDVMQSRQRPAIEVNIAARLATLSVREREVLDLLVAADQTKHIARKLQIKPKTVEHHRYRILQKMNVETVVELVRLVLTSKG